VGLGVDVGVTVAVAVDVGFGVAVGVAVGETVDVAVAVGVAVAVAVGEGVGVGVLVPTVAWIATMLGEPVLKYPTVAFAACGGWSASNRKLYNVPQRIAFAFWLVAKVSVLQVIELPSWITFHGVLL
jgi:hypothetical protein